GDDRLFIDNLTAGTYYFNAIDSFGCSVSDTTEIIEPDSLSAAINLKNVSCYNENTGVVSISVEGGVEPYFFNWNGIDPNALPSGDYSMEVLDWNFCLLQIDFTITQPDSLHLEISVQDEVEGESGGSAFVTVSGGTEPYSIEWSNGINEVPEINSLPAGDYFVQVTDANGCVQILEFT